MFFVSVFLPFLAFLFICFFGRFFGRLGCFFLGVFSLFLSLFASIFCFFEVGIFGSLVFLSFFNWVFSFDFLFFDWFFFFDSLSVGMLFTVIFVSFFVFIYSYDYLDNDPHSIRFFAFLLLFIFFMCLLVVSGNFVQLFFSWEGVGLCSYLLISFWYTRLFAVQSAFKAILVNKVGDVFLFFGFVLCFYVYGTLDFLLCFFFASIFSDYNRFLFFIVCFFFIGILAKSAQIGLHIWLPDAMEGPTPVSALLHAATMVAVGVFFFLRMSLLFCVVPYFFFFVSFISVLTCLISSMLALFQNDIKRIIAYSTCSQLGIMLASCSLFFFSVSFFHLFTHAFFKALLFLGSGLLIHFFLDEQDIRRMGGILNFFFWGYFFLLFGSLALVGFPFFSGFYSKDFIIELTFSFVFVDSFFVCFFVLFSSVFSILYSFRLIYLVFLGGVNSFFVFSVSYFRVGWFMLFSCVVLFLSSVFFGFFFFDIFLGLGSEFWFFSFISLNHLSFFFDSFFISFWLKNLVFFFFLLGLILGFFFNLFVFSRFFYLNKFFLLIYSFFVMRFFFDFVYNFFFNGFFRLFFFFVFDLDKGFLEFFGPFGIDYFLSKVSLVFKSLQSGFLVHYFFLFILGFFFLIFFFLFFYISFFYLVFCLFVPFLVYWFFC